MQLSRKIFFSLIPLQCQLFTILSLSLLLVQINELQDQETSDRARISIASLLSHPNFSEILLVFKSSILFLLIFSNRS